MSFLTRLQNMFSAKNTWKPKCRYYIQHFNKAGELIGTYELKNDITNQGKNALLDIMFHGTTQVTTWYIGLIDSSGYTAVAAGDTLASHAGWNEFTNYTGNRPAWPEDAASGQITTNGTAITIAILGSGTLKGTFLASVATGTSGTLWGTALYTTPPAVTNGDSFKVTYSIDLN